MKKLFAVLFILLVSSCNDGDLEIASFEFEEKVNFCDAFVLYRLSTNDSREALIVTLSEDQIINSGTDVISVNVSENGPYMVSYRIFNETVTSSYFCALIPPVEPKIKKNWQGTGGEILVRNDPVYSEDGITIIAYNHIIVLQDVVLKSGEETLIFDDTYLFGEFETAAPKEN